MTRTPAKSFATYEDAHAAEISALNAQISQARTQAIDDCIAAVRAASTNTGYVKTEVIASRLEALKDTAK